MRSCSRSHSLSHAEAYNKAAPGTGTALLYAWMPGITGPKVTTPPWRGEQPAFGPLASSLRPSSPPAFGPLASSLRPSSPPAFGPLASSLRPSSLPASSLRSSSPLAFGLLASSLRPSSPLAFGLLASSLRPSSLPAFGPLASSLRPSSLPASSLPASSPPAFGLPASSLQLIELSPCIPHSLRFSCHTTRTQLMLKVCSAGYQHTPYNAYIAQLLTLFSTRDCG